MLSTLDSTERYVYDDWNLIAVVQMHAQSSVFTLHTSSLWGMDLSQSLQGAGGVGGLLKRTGPEGARYPTYDGNGNVLEQVDATGAVTTAVAYDVFGTVIASTGEALPHGFSTKFTDPESGLLYYGYRYYDCGLGRWLNRDPIEEASFEDLYLNFWKSVVSGLIVQESDDYPFIKTYENGTNLYRFVKNFPSGLIDYLGLFCFPLGRITEEISCGGAAVWREGSWFNVVSVSVGPAILSCYAGCTAEQQFRVQERNLRYMYSDAQQCWTSFNGWYTERTNISYSSCAMRAIAGTNQFREKLTCLTPRLTVWGPSTWQDQF